jgi:CDP-diacylglycerol---glycerol-3-phosphate 3-phosphatidyltransferase
LIFQQKLYTISTSNLRPELSNNMARLAMIYLKRSWIVWSGICMIVLALAVIGLHSRWGLQLTLRWLIAAAGLLLYQLVYLYWHLDENRDMTNGKLLTRLGSANWLTVGRGALLALVAGFLFVPRPDGWLAWAPAGLYLSAMVVDYLDGYAARRAGFVTRLGSRLDMHFDEHGYIIGGLLVVLWGQAPVWYLLVALVRPLYVAGEWWWAKQNKTLRPWYPNPFRRALSGAQMGFTAVLLFPVFTPPGTTIAATLYMLPFLINFLMDWLWVSGVLPEAFIRPGERRIRWMNWMRNWFPLLLRAVLVGLLILRADQADVEGSMAELYAILHGVAIVAIMTGSAGRVFAVGVMLLSGFYLRADAGDWLAWAMLLPSLVLFFSGTGRFSMWTPEDWLIHHLAGEKAEIGSG